MFGPQPLKVKVLLEAAVDEAEDVLSSQREDGLSVPP